MILDWMQSPIHLQSKMYWCPIRIDVTPFAQSPRPCLLLSCEQWRCQCRRSLVCGERGHTWSTSLTFFSIPPTKRINNLSNKLYLDHEGLQLSLLSISKVVFVSGSRRFWIASFWDLQKPNGSERKTKASFHKLTSLLLRFPKVPINASKQS